MGNVVIKEVLLSIETNQWDGQESFEILSNTYRSGARSTATMGSCKGLVQIEMNDIESHVPRSNLAQNRVEVRPIVVEQTTRVMNRLCNLENILLENT